MGIDAHATRFLIDCGERGVDFEKTLMIGRQSLNVDPRRFKARLARRAPDISDEAVGRLLAESGGFAEPLFRWLGAREVDAIDASAYEKASIVHDLNQPVDASLHRRFSAVFEGGSLEHVFNFPIAIRNCMEMVAEGGHLLICTPANNYFGHGFYQFSPELFYRVLSPENGFEVVRMYLYGSDPEAQWYEVVDPHAVRRRVMLTNSTPASLAVCARRTRVVPIFANTPQQSDYEAAWTAEQKAGGATGATPAPCYSGGPARSRMLSRFIPHSVRRWIVQWRGMRARLDPECFKRVE
jgi:hypothetical protein